MCLMLIEAHLLGERECHGKKRVRGEDLAKPHQVRLLGSRSTCIKQMTDMILWDN